MGGGYLHPLARIGKAGGTHPTGMLSCFFFVFVFENVAKSWCIVMQIQISETGIYSSWRILDPSLKTKQRKVIIAILFSLV